ncbi:BQ5605_C008g05167 [Microbotryum silenes-dioicae]|uniref:Galactokinase n=1 Tax=Microbotryum silenes-dioicae TaxID=796604 RepID=A0A2X0N6A5_9BASI|nr:BQ5605_C008g05167 [Microbotryum silenes-dioicae]
MSGNSEAQQPADSSASIPVSSSLEHVYTPSSLPQQQQRWAQLQQLFEKQYGVKAQAVARAPGRVNIIGEHIDYCGFSVLPAAVERDVLIALSTSPKDTSNYPQPSQPDHTVIILRNVDDKFSPTHFEVDLNSSAWDVQMPKQHHWSSYFIAGTKGVLGHLYSRTAYLPSTGPYPSHVVMLVTGSVPEGSGLSSSSAFTIASSIAILHVVGRISGSDAIDRKAMTEVAIASERLVGVNSGGMDQAASVFSQPLHLLHIDFVPSLHAALVPLPRTKPGFAFVIANSLVTSNKAVTAKYCYNLRVAETRVGALLLAKHLGFAPTPGITFKTILDQYCSSPPYQPGPKSRKNKSSPLARQSVSPNGPTMAAKPTSPLPPDNANCIYEIKTMLGLAIDALGGPGMEAGMTWDEIAEKLGRDVDELEKEVACGQQVEPVGGRLKVWKRARHVLEEAKRVYEFVEILSESSTDDISKEASGSTKTGTQLLQEMGDLMNESMRSCQEDYECSCPGLDELVDLARKNGAIGSRLTGAGWGGATVSLVEEDKVAGFIKALKEGYYRKNFPKLDEQELDQVIFATKAEAGAGVVVF